MNPSRREFLKNAVGAAALTGFMATGIDGRNAAEAKEGSVDTVLVTGFPGPGETQESADENNRAVKEAHALAARLFTRETGLEVADLPIEFARSHESIGMYIAMYIEIGGKQYQGRPAYQAPEHSRVDMLDLAQYIKGQFMDSQDILGQVKRPRVR